jgi:ribonuclease HI
MFYKVPKSVLLASLLGLIPVLVGVASTFDIGLNDNLKEQLVRVSIIYSGFILSFMSGCIFYVSSVEKEKELFMWLSIVPVLLALFSITIPFMPSFVLALGFLILLEIERKLFRMNSLTVWWLNLRFPMTAIIVILLVILGFRIKKMKVKAYTDGACSGNPGPGGWGVYLIAEDKDGDVLKEESLYGKNTETTNQMMELTAAIQALESLKRKNVDITIFTDSKYVVNGITKWIHSWLKNNWKSASNKPVANKLLWEKLFNLTRDHNVTWIWVKGHAGILGNEKADSLAVKGREEAFNLLVD